MFVLFSWRKYLKIKIHQAIEFFYSLQKNSSCHNIFMYITCFKTWHTTLSKIQNVQNICFVSKIQYVQKNLLSLVCHGAIFTWYLIWETSFEIFKLWLSFSTSSVGTRSRLRAREADWKWEEMFSKVLRRQVPFWKNLPNTTRFGPRSFWRVGWTNMLHSGITERRK